MNYSYKNFVCLLLTTIAWLGTVNSGWSWDQDPLTILGNNGVHQQLVKYAAKNSVLADCGGAGTNCGYLEKLGFQNGLNEKFLWKDSDPDTLNIPTSVSLWLERGADKEDAGAWYNLLLPGFDDVRYTNHFHDPRRLWDAAGLDINNVGNTHLSAVVWAQNSTEQRDPKWVEGGPDKDWSLPAIQTYFYDALTATPDTTRQTNFAKLFRGLGHQLHLLQDMSVPNHVRNDVHLPFLSNIEKWTNENLITIKSQPVPGAFVA